MGQSVVGARAESMTSSVPRERHLAGIDGLRAFAAIAVLINHVGEFSLVSAASAGAAGTWSSYGAQGLTLFFAISGFLLYLPFASALLSDRPMPSIKRFATNRVLRIFPAYLVVFAIVFVAGALLILGTAQLQLHPPGDVGRITDPRVLVPNLFLVQTYVPCALSTGIGPAWSLTAELTFYALLPLVGLMTWALVRRGVSKVMALLAGPGIFIVIGLVTTAALGYATRNLSPAATLRYEWGPTGTAVLARSFLAQADLFGYGMLAAVAIEWLRSHNRVPVLSTVVKAAVLGGLLVVVAGCVKVGGGLPTSVVGVCAALLILLTVLPSSRPGATRNSLARFLDLVPIRYVGLVSYSLYLWHQPVILWMKGHGLLDSSGPGALVYNVVIVFLVAMVLASITYYLVEKPAMSLRGRLPARTVVMG
jgi:peptidoglycan/LPS O-acetylase OafA/YrhL